MTRSSTKVTKSSQTSGCQITDYPDYWFTVYISLTVTVLQSTK